MRGVRFLTASVVVYLGIGSIAGCGSSGSSTARPDGSTGNRTDASSADAGNDGSVADAGDDRDASGSHTDDAGGDASTQVDAGPAAKFFRIGTSAQTSSNAFNAPQVSAVVDVSGSRLLVLGSSSNDQSILELNCRNLDGSACTTPYVALSSTANTGIHPSGAILGSNLLVVAGGSSVGALSFYTCPLSTLACPAPSSLLAPGSMTALAGVDPVLLTDPTDSSQILVAASVFDSLVDIWRCDIDGTSCAAAKLGSSAFNSTTPAMTVDTVNGNVLVAVYDTSSARGDLGLFSCPLTGFGTGCSNEMDLSTVAGWTTTNTGAWPTIAFDSATQTVFVAATRFNTTDNELPGYFACKLASPASATAPYTCKFQDLSSLFPTGAQYTQWTPSLAVAGGHLLLVTQNDATNAYNSFLFDCPTSGTGSCTTRDISGASPQCDTGYFPFATVHGSTLYVAEEALNACPNDETTYGPALSVAPF